MARARVELKRTETILDELEGLHQAISRRAYDIFRRRGTLWGGSLSDWVAAEHELVWKPAVEVRQKEDQFEVLAALPGVEARALDVQVTPEDLLIKAEIAHGHTPDKGIVHLCEFDRGRLFRSIHFPERIDPDSVRTEYRNGMLRLTAAIARRSRKVEIQAA
jgi:HSP20 family protein